MKQGQPLAIALVAAYVLAFAYGLVWFRTRADRSEIDKSNLRRTGAVLQAMELAQYGRGRVLAQHVPLCALSLLVGYAVTSKNYVLLALAAVAWWFVDDRLSRFMLLRSYGIRVPAGLQSPTAPVEPPVSPISDAIVQRLRVARMQELPLQRTWFAELSLSNDRAWEWRLPTGDRYPNWRCAVCVEERIFFTQLITPPAEMRDGCYAYLLSIDQDLICVDWGDGGASIRRDITSRRYPQDLLKQLADQGARLVTHDRQPFAWRQ